jgi:hypothetical protein
MNTDSLNYLLDNRTHGHSVMATYSLKNYLKLVEAAYANKGGLAGQREALTTSTARRIRQRMVEDLKAGAILPPVVLGMVWDKPNTSSLMALSQPEFEKKMSTIPDKIVIIDGMQRTAAMQEVANSVRTDDYLNTTPVRVEFWLTESINSLTYRMLVLNTGRIPWDLRRQLELIFRSIVSDIQNHLPHLKVIKVGDKGRRTRAGEYQAGELLELFLAFGLRREKINLQERIAEEFARLDFIEATEDSLFIEEFKTVFAYLVQFDEIFDNYRPRQTKGERFKKGQDLFGSHPARIGFMAAWARTIMGKPGMDRTGEEKQKKLTELSNAADFLLNKFQKMNAKQLGKFLDLSTLNEILGHRASSIGDYERAFFLKAFETLIEEKFEVKSFTVCWRAYSE